MRCCGDISYLVLYPITCLKHPQTASLPHTRHLQLQVRAERAGVERETENANIEADKVARIQNEVSRKQADAETDLAKAEPAVLAAMSALDTLDKSQLGQCKTMSVPPPGVVDIFIACMVGVPRLGCADKTLYLTITTLSTVPSYVHVHVGRLGGILGILYCSTGR